MTRKKLSLPLLILSTSLLLGACSPTTTPQTKPDLASPNTPIDLKTEFPDVTLTGTVIQAGTRFSLSSSGKPPVELNSRKIKLVDYVSKIVTVTGQYSGTTLFVDKIE